jgi:hypothetical protein
MAYDWRGVRTKRIKAVKFALAACAAIFVVSAPLFALTQIPIAINFYW